jgi:uroporphyrinogen-III synthase
MHILLTRPESQSLETVTTLRARGHGVMHVPLIRIEADTGVDLGDGPYVALAVTSANAIDAIARHPRKDMILGLLVFAVGKRTAESARMAGFQRVVSAEGDVMQLAQLILQHVPSNSPILYLAGEYRAGDLKGSLEAKGYRVHIAEIYRAVAAKSLPAEAVQALQADSIDAVLHYSRRSAETLLRLAEAGSCLVNVLKCKHFCLSAQIAEPFVEAGAQQTLVARRPDETALLDLVGNV